jgi:hypothetical protein
MLLYAPAFGLPHPHMLTGAKKAIIAQEAAPPNFPLPTHINYFQLIYCSDTSNSFF